MKRKTVKKIISFLLAAVLVVGALPFNAFATETEDTVTCTTDGCTLLSGHEGACNNQQLNPCETEGCTLSSGHDGDCNNQVTRQCETEGCTLTKGHEGDCNNQLPAQCETEGCTLSYGHEGECNTVMVTSDDVPETATPISVYVSVTMSGELQKTKDGTYMAYREVSVEDTDTNGIISLHDVMLCAHRQYYNGYCEESPGYALSEGENKNVATFWGISKNSDTFTGVFFYIVSYNTKIFYGDTGSDSTINVQSTAVTEGQYISISTINGSTYGAGIFGSLEASNNKAYFVPDISVPVNKELQLTLCYAGQFTTLNLLDGYNIYVIDENGTTVSSLKSADNEDIVTKTRGAVSVFTAIFSEPGTYTLVTQPKVHGHGYGAAVVRVHAYESIPLNVTDIKVGLDTKLTESLISFDAKTKEYDITIPEGTKYLYGSITYSTSEKLKSELCGKLEIYKNDEWKTNSGNSGNTIKSVIMTDAVWNARITAGDKYVQNAALSEYNFNIKRLPFITGITTDLILTSDYTSKQNTYTAILNDSADSFYIQPTTSKTTHIVKINGNQVTSGEKSTIDVSSLTFNEAGETELTISVSDTDERYIENTYKFTIIKAPVNDVPSVLQKLKDGSYLVGASADALSILASASGSVTYQWYCNSTNSTENGQEIAGETSSTYTPPTDTAGTFYYFCKVTNSTTQDSVYSNVAQIKVYPDPTPKISWKTEIPKFDADTLTYLEGKHPTGKLPDDAKVGDDYYGYYYRADDKNIVELQVNATSDASDGEMVYYWSYRQPIGGGSQINFHKEANYTPDTSTANGARVYSVKAGYKLLGETYWSDTIYVYVFTDEAKGTYPTQAGAISWEGDGTKDNPWLLMDQEDLEELRGFVNDGYTFANMYLAFGQNIEVDTTWKGIGDGDGYSSKGVNIKPFSGDLNGGNYTLTYAKGSQYPLFNYVREATVHDLTIYAPYIANYGLVANYVVDYGEDGDYNVGTGGSYAPGCPDTIDITNVTIKSGSIILNSGFIGGGASGGNTVNITGCTVQNNVKIGCYEDGTSANQPLVASFAGTISGSVTNCISYADVYGSNSVAGIVVGKSQSMGKFDVRNNAFIGNVYATGNYAGGIVAQGYSADSAPNAPCVSIVNCYAVGNITGKNYVGGIFGGEPGVVQTWQNGVGNIKNNFFYGTVKATSGQYAGGIIGYMKSLNMYNCIENNYYLNTGALKAIGGVNVIDTSAIEQHPAWIDGTYYINSAVDDLKSVDYEIFGNNNYEYVKNANHNRNDDPIGKDADKLGKAMTATEFANGTVTLLLNQHDASYKNWGQGQDYPVFNGKDIVVKLEVSGTFKTEYTVGDQFDRTGIVLTATWSSGKVTTPAVTEAKISGFDSTTRGEKEVTISYENASCTITVLVKQKSGKIDVTISVLGDTAHNSDTDGKVHTLANGSLSTWISATTYTVDSNATVKTVLEKALTEHGLSYSNPSGNYVSSINGLSEFTNGKNSGWMYTLNGSHPQLGVAQQYLNDGDVIVFHYTDDYTKEQGSWVSGGDTDAVSKVEALIAKIGTVTINSKSKIDAARKAYDNLTFIEKKQVSNYGVLTAAETKYLSLKETADKKAAQNVEDLIDKIDNEITVQSKAAIEAARKAYNALSTDQRKYVDSAHYSKLVNAEKKLAELTATDEDKKAAQEVMDLIDKLGTITLNSEKEVEAARNAYNKLSDTQKALVDNYDVLEAAEDKLIELRAAAIIENIYVTTGDYLEGLGVPQVGSIGGEWMVIGLARSDRSIPSVEDYYNSVVKYVQENIDENERLHNTKSTDNSRIILALTALGKDVTNVGNHNLLMGLNDLDYIQKQGINGPIWALIALDSGNYPVPEGNISREALIQTILDAQLNDGGWALSGEDADSDITGMALQALAQYYDKDRNVRRAVDDAISTLSMMQNADGSYSSVDGASSESISQIIVALTALGIDPAKDERFIKNDVSVLDALLEYYVTGGGFKHVLSGNRDGMATEQAYYALTSYYRFLKEKTSLYDMTDIIDMSGDPDIVPTEPTTVPTEPNEVNDEGGFPWGIMIVVLIVGIGIGGCAVVILPKMKQHGKYM